MILTVHLICLQLQFVNCQLNEYCIVFCEIEKVIVEKQRLSFEANCIGVRSSWQGVP